MPLELPAAQILIDNAQRFAELPAYVCEGRMLTHRELYDRADRLTAALEARGLRRQDRVAAYGRNSIEYGEILAMGQLSGIVVATVNFRLAAAEAIQIIADAAPRVLFVDADLFRLVADDLATLPTIELVVALDPSAGPTPAGCLPLAELLASAGDRSRTLEARGDDVANLIYTSGTTGRPKGCMLGQHGLRWMAFTTRNEMRTDSSDRALLVMPLFHIGAMAIGLAVHARGGTVVLHRQFDTAAALNTIAADAITVLHLAPTMLQALLAEAESQDRRDALAGVRVVVYSAAPITSTTLAAAMTAMPQAGFTNMYGQTEVITSGLPFDLHDRAGRDERAARRLASVGFPFPDTEVRIVDAEDRDVPLGEPGEILVRNAAVFLGYWNDSAATVATLRDGWCRTGDIGRMDDEGLLHLVDRKKDVVISGGENIYSLEVEDAVTRHHDVVECAVIGLPDQQWGEAVTAVVVVRDEATLTLEQLRTHLESHLAHYKQPKRLIVVSELPKLATGKLDKKLLRATYAR